MFDSDNDKSIICFCDETKDYGCFSNLFPAKFYYCNRVFDSVEQFLLYSKAMMFGCYDLAKQFMICDDPATIKTLSTLQVPEFDSDVWDKTCYAIAKRGVRAKFAQNEELLEELLSTGNKTLAGAFPRDVKWGIGIAIDDPERFAPAKWRGENLLGKILMEVRDELRFASHHPESMWPHPAENIEFDEWHMGAGELAQNPRFAATIHAYADNLTDFERETFLGQWTLNDWETAIRTDKGASLPTVGFWEMKQDIFDIVRLGQCLEPVEYKDRDEPFFRELMEKIAEEEGREYEAENERLKNDPAYAVPPETTERMLKVIEMASLAKHVDFEACYDHLESLLTVLEAGDFRYPDIGRPDMEKIKTLAAAYEVQTYLANKIAELQSMGILKDDEGEDYAREFSR